MKVEDAVAEDVQDDEREGEGAPPILREPQDERNGAPRKPRKGTGGPKTAAGKARVRLNAMRHGILADTPVLPRVESEEEWEKLRRDVLDWFGFEGPFQESLGERVATLIWRLKRASRAACGVIAPCSGVSQFASL